MKKIIEHCGNCEYRVPFEIDCCKGLRKKGEDVCEKFKMKKYPSSSGGCYGGGCHQCTEYETCPVGQASEY